MDFEVRIKGEPAGNGSATGIRVVEAESLAEAASLVLGDSTVSIEEVWVHEPTGGDEWSVFDQDGAFLRIDSMKAE
jgi:hypothetical protein